MAEMALGYGSEYQLLRFLGHHRNELNKEIRKNTELKGDLIWLDYPKNNKRDSLDDEYKGLNFIDKELFLDENNYKFIKNIKLSNSQTAFNENHFDFIKKNWKQSWDGIIIHTNNSIKEIVFVEAKAHTEELKSNGCQASENSKKIIRELFNQAIQVLGIIEKDKIWLEDLCGKYYQFANRLTTAHFLNKYCGIKASLLNVYFLNGYKINETKNVKSEDKWKEAIKQEFADSPTNCNFITLFKILKFFIWIIIPQFFSRSFVNFLLYFFQF